MMTGKLLGPAPGDKPKKPPSDAADAGSSDDENRTMLSEGCKRQYELEVSSCGCRWSQGWAAAMFHHQLPDWLPQRYVLCTLAHIGFFLLYVIRSTMSVAVIRMTQPYAVLEGDKMVTHTDFDWTVKEQGYILSSFFCGYIATQIPGGYWAMKYGGRRVFGAGLFFASVASIFTPLLGNTCGYYGIIFARFLCGIFEGVTYPAIHAMWNHWAPPKERTGLVSFAFAGAYLGAAATMSQSVHAGSLMTGWEDLFYVSGALALVWTLFWFSWGAEYPEHDPMVSGREIQHIYETIGFPSVNDELPVPWKHILLSPQVMAICVCHFAANWGFYTILTELPTFLSDALQLDGNQLGFYATLPFLAMTFSAAFGGILVDKTLHRFMNTTNTRKVTVAITFIAQMMFFFLTGKATERIEYIAYISAAMFFCGLCWSGFGANHLDIAPDYASVLLGVTNTFGTLPGILSPIVTSAFVKNMNDPGSWSIVFLLAGYIYLAAALFYVLFGGGERQDWADGTESVKLKSVKKQVHSEDVETASE